jgi:hypothetical protein
MALLADNAALALAIHTLTWSNVPVGDPACGSALWASAVRQQRTIEGRGEASDTPVVP